ncbi:2-amino-4-hydroxy-6-hydroxymethyldihydropteridine diphosphokinase [Thalassobacillus pellis]|uniref:2-amino-4-hydroxy-6- hydroxymethyldihydropteridine diphosphokinase n=1 Tax=Thalassobacillus pellis TaxID=748008 RepID=UPI00196079E8|nr:2-amino-4-hydroxy-6-hydroxymethyldihydropteridine diphosphokinase [Thalassobacillus pellis]MBM7555152.1 2-amino-4-hydroxy-6-hydroxymethyldihydropteridine diphosphokinase [Thalassobacillus pellis]
MNEVYIALGSNISPRAHYLANAIERLAIHPDIQVIKQSAVYETVPVGLKEQSDFLNMVIKAVTDLGAEELLSVCQEIERNLGREREIKWGPRTIDLDILLYNQENIVTERLIVPHPAMHERAFVLVPLAEIASGAIIPTKSKTVQAVLDTLPEDETEGVRKWQINNGEDA